jgi:hypothetical protein
MAQMIVREPSATILELKKAEAGLFPVNHIFEPEYHQAEYVDVCTKTANLPGAFQIGDPAKLAGPVHRGVQPAYADDENDPTTLEWEGMLSREGDIVDAANGKRDVCALKSTSVRFGYMDLESARSVPREVWVKTVKARVILNDVLVNSTGDGTIGRVAVFNYDFPAVVDGHISILRFRDAALAWYVAAYLLSADGQRQLYRYINGSSGQVEIYPQDIERVWVKPASTAQMKTLGSAFKSACENHDQFARDLKKALFLV